MQRKKFWRVPARFMLCSAKANDSHGGAKELSAKREGLRLQV
jgi:hypothetical protein